MEKFNGGLGAEICDQCSTMLLEGLRPPAKGGGYERVLKPVVLDAYPPGESRLAFCSVRCACLYLLGEETTQPERFAVAHRLMVFFGKGGDIEPPKGTRI